MEDEKVTGDETPVPESPKPLAFTIDFGSGKVDNEKHKSMMEKYQKRHRRGQSLSKLEDSAKDSKQKHPLSGNLPRKNNFAGGYSSSNDTELCDTQVRKVQSANARLRDNLTLPLKNTTTDRMSSSYPNSSLPSISSPVELKDISSPELDLVSPFSPLVETPPCPNTTKKVLRQHSSPEVETHPMDLGEFIEGNNFEFDRQSDSVSDAGTYTIDAENYSEEQKARMSIDTRYNIEEMSVLQKTEEYILSLHEHMEKHNIPIKNNCLEVENDVRTINNSVGVESNKKIVNRDVECDEICNKLQEITVKARETRFNAQEMIGDRKEFVCSKKEGISNTKESVLNKKVGISNAKEVKKVAVSKIKGVTNKKDAISNRKENVSNIKDGILNRNDISNREDFSNTNEDISNTKESISNSNEVIPNKKEAISHTKEAISNSKQAISDKIEAVSNKKDDISNTKEAISNVKDCEKFIQKTSKLFERSKVLSPILSPTQNMSILQQESEVKPNNNEKNFTKIMMPSAKAKIGNGLETTMDQGSVISVTSSGAFRPKGEKERTHTRKLSLTQSEVQVEAYTDNSFMSSDSFHTTVTYNRPNLTTNLVHVGESIPGKNNELKDTKITNLPPAVGGVSGKASPSKIPSPIHRPRSRNSNIDLSDSSLETESYLKPTQNYINSLQQRLSLDSESGSEYDTKYLNNDHRSLLKNKPTHVRHNSFDDRSLKSNKLEHFKNKNFIDQTSNVFNQYVHKIQNSPNNSPIRRSSSFSTKNQINAQNKCSNVKEINVLNSPNFTRNSSIQRSASTASIKPNMAPFRRSSVSDHPKIDRNQFGDTESSSEEDFEKNLLKKKDITNTRYNRAFSLRRARLDEPQVPPLKCPNTPEMRRKFVSNERPERAISVDRKPTKTNEVQSRYMLNATRGKNPPTPKQEPKAVPKGLNLKGTSKPQVFSRTDSGRFSMRATSKPPGSQGQKTKKDGSGKKQSGPRSNSSLSSREVEFQNWKRRKSYDPMKAAAEGKRKAEQAKKQTQSNMMTQSFTESQNDYDSSPSHSSSVHRSQSFHGTAALGQLLSSDEDDLTLSADEGFSPPTPSPCELSPARASLRYAWKDRLLH